MEKWRAKFCAWGRLIRIDKPVGTLLLSWSSLWGLWTAGQGQPPAHVVAIVLLGTLTMRSAGCVLNDFADRHFDGKVERTRHRPLVTGELSEQEALLVGVFFLFISLLLVLMLNWQSLVLSIFCACVAIIYPFCKRFFPIPQMVLGVAFASAILIAHTAVLGYITWGGIFLFLGNACWALVYDTYYALVDREDDITLGLHSSAITMHNRERGFIVLMAALMMTFLVLAGLAMHINGWYYIGLLIACALIAQEIYIIRNLNKAACFYAFHHSNWVGAAIWAGIILAYLSK